MKKFLALTTMLSAMVFALAVCPAAKELVLNILHIRRNSCRGIVKINSVRSGVQHS